MPQAERAEGPSEPTTGSSGHRRFARAVGLGVVTGAADDDCSAIGTYASAGAQFGTALLWTAPVTFPMMFAVVYLSSKLGQVSGKGLFHVIREIYPGWILWPALIGVLIGNTIEAAADLGGMAAALQLFIPVATPIIVVIIAAMIVALQLCGSYELIRNIFRWLALALFAYVASALLARPDPWEVLRGTLVPTIHFSRDFLSILVAIIGTSLSAYLYTWQSNVEVEEKIAQGRVKLRERQGSSESDLHKSRMDILTGMLFSNVIMYFIVLATGATLFKAGQTNIDSATQAAEALRPLAGDAAGILFAVGIIAVGFLAIPVMTTGAAYDLCQVLGWKSSLHEKPSEAPAFYLVITGFTAAAACLNFLGLNPMRALIYSGIVQGFSTPPLLLFILMITNNRRIMGDKVNSLPLNILSCATVIVIFAASIGLVMTWFI